MFRCCLFDVIITIDSREQNKIDFTSGGSVSRVEVDGLPFSDYWAYFEDETPMPVTFERKNINDLFGTLSSGIERFKKELERARENNFKIVLIIEGSLSEVIAGTKYSEVEGKTILKTLMTLWVKYDVFPVFCNNRSEMKRYMLELWEAIGRNYKPKEKVNLDTAVVH